MPWFALFLFTALLTPGYLVQAQISTSFDSSISGAPTLEKSPLYPDPYASVRISLNDYSSDASGSAIQWRIGGVAQPELANQRTITLPTGKAGVSVRVEAILTTPNGQTITVAESVTPQYLDIVIEPQTRVPNHYTGRALPSTGSTVNATALFGENGGGTTLYTYTWRLNNTVLLGGPVRGQKQASFVMPEGSALLEVTIQDTDGTMLGSKSIELVNSTPFLHFYSINSLYGMSRRPVGDSLTLIGNNTTVRAEPYYLDLQTYNNPDLAEWSLSNGLGGTRGQNPYDLTLIRTASGQSESVSFHVRNLTDILKGAQRGFIVQ